MALLNRDSRRLVPLFHVIAVLALSAVIVLLGVEAQKSQAELSREVSSQAATQGLKTFTSVLNLRINELREELIHLNAEQANLGRALSEAERERLVFYRRDQLAAFAVLVHGGASGDNDWVVQKAFFRNRSGRDSKTTPGQTPTDILTSAMSQVRAPGFLARKIDAKPFGAGWTGEEGILVAFLSTDDAGKPYGLVAVLRPSYVFSVCRFFAEQDSNTEGAFFVLDQTGQALCHSQPRFDATKFASVSYYPLLTQAADSGATVQYSSVSGVETIAAAKKVALGAGPTVLVVREVASRTEASPSKAGVLRLVTSGPWSGLRILAAVLFLLNIVLGILVFLRRPPAAAAKANVELSPQAIPVSVESAPARAQDLVSSQSSELEKHNKDNRLKKEVKELEDTVLLLQASRAYTAQYLKNALELPLEKDLVDLTLGHLRQWNQSDPSSAEGGSWQVRAAWLPYKKESGEFVLDESVHWSPAEEPSGPTVTAGAEDVTATDIEVGDSSKSKHLKLNPTPSFEENTGETSRESAVWSSSLFSDPAVRRALAQALGRDDFFIQPVYFREELLGILALAGIPHEGTEAEQLFSESLPQVAEIFASALKIRQL